MIEAANSVSSGEEDADIDNWMEFCKKDTGELPKFQTLRRREVAAAKLRKLIHKLDDEFDRAILQLGEDEMDGYVTYGGEDSWTGYLSTARRKGPKEDGKENKLTNATARVQHQERSKEMVSIFKAIVRSHDKQLKNAVLTLTKQHMDSIVRRNHEKFSGTHKQTNQKKGKEPRMQAKSKGVDHAFVTPRVKSAAKSREAVSLLNQIVVKKDGLLKKAIENMDRKEKTLLTNQNNDFLKFEAQRAQQREEFRVTKKTKTCVEHPHATKRVRQEARAKTALEELKTTGQKKTKALASSVKRIPKPQRDRFVRQVNGVTTDKIACIAEGPPAPAARKRKKTLDTKRYARAEVMSLSRRVKTDVHSAIQTKDEELGKMVATMDEEELRALADFGPTGMEDINLWKRDRRKRSWRRLSAFGVVRDDPLLYHRWKQQQRQHRLKISAEGAKVESQGQDEMFGTMCTAGRRPPWSTDLHYTHRHRPQRQQAPREKWEGRHGRNKGEQHPQQRKQQNTLTGEDLLSTDTRPITSKGTTRSGHDHARRKCVHTAPSSRESARVVQRTRPASAPLGAGDRITPQPPDQLKTARTPSLARLAQVFYQSSVAHTVPESGEWSSPQRHAECPAKGVLGFPDNHETKLGIGPESYADRRSKSGSRVVNVISARAEGREIPYQDRSKIKNNPDLHGAEKRMESVRLLWAVSQLSADAVTKKIMHGYSERQRAREPNRPQWKMRSGRAQ
ncbi:unnamed protein product, partial [Scytosiphon promiscuus]